MSVKNMFFREGYPKKPGESKKEKEVFTSWDTAYVSWYNFLCVFLWIPFAFGIIRTIINLSEWGGIPNGILLPVFLYDNFSRIFIVVASFLAVMGLRKKMWSGVIWFFIYVCSVNMINIINGIIISLVYAASGIDYSDPKTSAGAIFGYVLFTLLFCVPNWIYFSKRRPLFLPYFNTVNTATSEKTVEQNVQRQSNQTYRVCPNCANLFPSDQDVCECGFIFFQK